MSFVLNTNNTAIVARSNSETALQGLNKSMTNLSNGKKFSKISENASGIVISDKINGQISRKNKYNQNLQNSLSFLQSQHSTIRIAASLVTRASELKHRFHSVIANQGDKENYDKEFREIQLQLKEMQAQKFNGVSLFASGNIKSLASASEHSSILQVKKSDSNESLNMHRTGIFDSLFVEKSVDETINLPNFEGDGKEWKQTVDLKFPSGSIEWDIDSISAPDKFSIMQGTDLLFEEIIGFPGVPPFIPAPTVFFKDGTSGNAVNQEKLVNVDFPISPNNNSSSIDFIVNKSDQIKNDGSDIGAGEITWNASINISYDPYEISLTDGNLYSLNEFSFDEFSGFVNVLSNAISQNASSQQRILSEIDHLNIDNQKLESADSKIMDADIAYEASRMAKFNLLAQSSAKMIGQANNLFNIALTLINK
jgi:flagellin-like hook-associated protein FlgL